MNHLIWHLAVINVDLCGEQLIRIEIYSLELKTAASTICFVGCELPVILGTVEPLFSFCMATVLDFISVF
jgi:hypothetical protein